MKAHLGLDFENWGLPVAVTTWNLLGGSYPDKYYYNIYMIRFLCICLSLTNHV